MKNLINKFNTNISFNIVTIVIFIITSIFMFFWINQKEGFHEDEIFSYGSSNYKWDNLFQASAKSDYLNRTIEQYIIGDNIGETISSIFYYMNHQDEFGKLSSEIHSKDKPEWKSPEDAKEYVTIEGDDVFNYLSVYYNQSRDVHPPLFYMLVHLVSSFFYGTFSKYIIFFINLVFFLLTCYMIRKTFTLFNKKWLGIVSIILYGFSMGAVSTVIFLRMYSMLTFFCITYLYLNLKILNNKFEINKKNKFKLCGTILLGFLTQYYFCFFAILVFILMSTMMIAKKEYKIFIKYLLIHIISALLGIILFPPSIYHIFFSYRGIGGQAKGMNITTAIAFYINILSEAYSINNIFIILIIGLTILGGTIIFAKKVIKKEKKENLFKYLLIVIPTIIYFTIISKMAPNTDAKYAIRYIMPILPEISIIFVLISFNILKNNISKYVIGIGSTLIITVNGMITNEPQYLYRGYNEYIKLANEYKDLDYVYAVDNAFTYLTSMPEFMIYNKSIIINMNYDKLDFLKEDEELQKQDKYILSIKKWMNVEDTLNKILANTGFTKYEILLDNEDDTQSIIYLVSR